MAKNFRKPKGTGVIATDAGWVKVYPSGRRELLISSKGLLAKLEANGLNKYGHPVPATDKAQKAPTTPRAASKPATKGEDTLKAPSKPQADKVKPPKPKAVPKPKTPRKKAAPKKSE